MKQVEFWQWVVDSETPPGKRIKTRHHMTEADALARDPTAVRVPGSLIVRSLPVTEDEFRANTTSAFFNDK